MVFLKKITLSCLIIVTLFISGCDSIQNKGALAASGVEELRQAFLNKRSDFFVESEGFVVRVLSDDLVGSRHQRFIVMLPTRQTLLISHNIDVAERIADLTTGDRVHFRGEYQWNDKGGVIHWTHRDPKSQRIGGWIKHGTKTYQ